MVKEHLMDNRAMEPPPDAPQDALLYRILVTGFVVIAVLVVCAATWLALAGKELSDGVIAIGAGAVGALGGLLAPKQG
jgi:hypothetical protein